MTAPTGGESRDGRPVPYERVILSKAKNPHPPSPVACCLLPVASSLRGTADGRVPSLRAGVLLEPIGDLLEAALAVLGLAGAGELVGLAVEEAEPGLHAPVH